MSISSQTVFIVDDDMSVCRSLGRLMRLAGLEARTFSSAEDFLETQTKPLSEPSCLVLDLQMPGLSGLDLQSRMSASEISCPVIFISGNGSIPTSVQAMRQGALTFLPKPFDNEELLRAIAEALDRHRDQLASVSQVSAVQERVKQLSERELEVMSWIITGALNKQIGAALGIAERTVKLHRARVLEKMQSVSVADLVRLCAVAGVEPAVK